jgi:hypothetical protein
MIETNTIVRIQKCESTLNFMGFNHPLKDILNGKMLALTSQVIGNCKNGAKVVRGMAPYKREEKVRECIREKRHTFFGEKAVIKVEPANDGANVECPSNRVELIVGSGNLGTCVFR